MIVEAPDGKIIDFGDLPAEQVNSAMRRMYQQNTQPVQKEPVIEETEPKESTFISRTMEDLKKRGDIYSEIERAYNEGRMTGPESALGGFARVGLGGIGDIAANVIGTGLRKADELTGGYGSDILSSALGGVADMPAGISEGTVGDQAVRGIGALTQKYEQFSKENPRTANILESVGNIIAVAPPLKAAYTSATPVVKGVANTVQKASKFIQKPAIIGSEQLKARAGDLFKLAEQQGGNLKPEFMNEFVSKIALKAESDPLVKSLVQAGGGRDAYGDVLKVTKEYLGQPMTFERAKALDETLGALAYDTADDFGKLSRTGQQYLDMQHTLRNMIDKAPETAFEGGSSGFAAAKEARKNWSAMMRMRDIERIIDNAEFYPQPATRIQTGMRQLLQRKDIVNRSPAEVKAIKEAARTGAVTGLLKVFGSGLGPVIAGSTGAIASGGLGGGLAAIPAYAVQKAARAGSEALQLKKAMKVKDVIASSVQDTRRPITIKIEELAQKTGKSVKELMQMEPKDVKKMMGE